MIGQPQFPGDDQERLRQVLALLQRTQPTQPVATVPPPEAAPTRPLPQQVAPPVTGVQGPTPGNLENLQAADLEKQATPPAGPKGWKQQLAYGVMSGLAGMNYPGGAPAYEAARQATEHQREQDLLKRAMELRQMGTQKEEFGQRQNLEQQQLDLTKQLRQAELLKLTKPEAFTLSPGETRFEGTTPVATMPPKAETTQAPKVNYDSGIPVSVTGPDKTEYPIGDPKMPPNLKALADSAVASHKQRLTEQANIADTLSARQDARAQAAAERNARIQASAPDPRIKDLVTAGYLTKDAVENVQELMAKYPDLVGPAMGRAEQAAQGLGTSFGLQDPAKETAAANLSKNFADLIINEARVASPGRTNKELLDIVRASSAKMSQDPTIIRGFINGAIQSADRGINEGKRWGIDLEAQRPKGSSTPGPAPTKKKTVKFEDLPK